MTPIDEKLSIPLQVDENETNSLIAEYETLVLT